MSGWLLKATWKFLKIFTGVKMDTEAKVKIKQLKLEKLSVEINNLFNKIGRFQRANDMVHNAVAQQNIDDMQAELDTKKLDRKILSTEIVELKKELGLDN